MNRMRFAALCVAVTLSATALSDAQAPRTPPNSNHVVVISLDGFPGWAMEDPYLPVPTLRRLAASGAIARTMRPVDPTVTWANHTSMITGVTPAQHGVIFNGLLIRKPGVAPVVEPWRDKQRAGPQPHALRCGARERPDHRAGRLGGDPERAVDHLGIPGTARSQRGRSRRRPSRPAFSRRPISKASPRRTSSGGIGSGRWRRRTSSGSTVQT